MTNQRKSYIVSIFVILALAFGATLISQGLMARAVSKHELVLDDSGIRLSAPLPSNGIAVKKAIQAPKTPSAFMPEGEVASDVRTVARAAASAENGGETYATATVIPAVPYSDLGTTVGAVYDYNASCGNDGAGDVVYSFTPAINGVMYVTTCTAGSPAGVDTKVWVMKAVPLTELACNDDDPACAEYASTLTANVTAGAMYYIVVGAYAPGAESGFEIFVDVIPEGHDFIAPMAITFPEADSLIGHVYSVDLTGLPQGNASVTGSTLARSFYYNFTAPVNGMYTFTWCDDGTVPLIPYPPTFPDGRWTAITWPAGPGVGAYAIAPYAGGIPSPSTCAINGPFSLTFVKVVNTTQMIEICTRQGEEFKGTLTVTWTPLPLYNDDCADALDLTDSSGIDVFGHNLGATLDGPGIDGCSPSDPSEVCADVWYKWTAPSAGFAQFSMCAGETDNKMWVYRGADCLSVSPREAEGCSDDGCGASGGPSFDELPCAAGETFLVRIGGWYIEGDPTYGDCPAFGMGVFYINCDVFAASVKPVNDACNAVVPVALVSGVISAGESGTTDYSGWDCIPHLLTMPEPNVWHAFSISYCADVVMSNCGMPDGDGLRYSAAAQPWAPAYYGCPCAGGYVEVLACLKAGAGTGGPYCAANGYPAGFTASRYWKWCSLIPGDYFVPVSYATVGIVVGGSFLQWFDYNVQFKATGMTCAYCPASGNPAMCPPDVGGSIWIDRVSISNMVYPAVPAVSGCNAYQDFSLQTANVYRGLPYTLTVRYGRWYQNAPAALTPNDSVDVWVDWNQNSGLAATPTELGERTRLTYAGQNMTCTLNVPLDAALPGDGATGNTRMRVRIANALNGANQACGSTNAWGEVEDYTLVVSNLECGDFNVDGNLNSDDIAFLRAYYFGSGPAPDFWQRADVDGDDAITIADIIALADAAYGRPGGLHCM